MLKIYRLRDYDFILVILLAAISIIGILLVGSADPSLQSRQMAGVIMGFVIMVILSLIDYSWILHMSRILYGLILILLAAVLITGVSSHGAARWIEIGGLQFQPTELAKVIIILFFANYFMNHQDTISSWKEMIKSVLLLAVPLAMIARQPDLKNTITIIMIFFAMLFAAGLSYKKIGIILLVGFVVIFSALFLIIQTDLPIIQDYQKQRIMSFLSVDTSDEDLENTEEDTDYTESRMQQENSIMAIGSGQLNGKGLNNSDVNSVSKGNFVAEAQNDFIFAVAGEELGFRGCLLIIFLLGAITAECMRVGQKAKDTAGKLIGVGMGSLIAVQSIINISVATGLFPNTGTPLPFVSYGLTSLVSLFIGMGFVLNVGLQQKKEDLIVNLKEKEIDTKKFIAGRY
ncbi:MAG: FtsW/RodA/SpoVE family cell cycle protein [Eubacterium sp.]|nr:FtsW/RodA/SpoVE family cell cycle protein [Eubacterium sp.]